MIRFRQSWLPILLLLCCRMGLAQPVANEVHVSSSGDKNGDGSAAAPFGSIRAALDQSRKRIAAGFSGDLRIIVQPGRHELSETLRLSDKNVPTGGSLTIRAAKPGSVIISGGRRVEGWTKAKNQTWVSDPLPELEQRVPGRQLFVGGKRGIRAREPDDGYFRVAEAGKDGRTSFSVEEDAWPSLSKLDPENLRLVEVGLLHDWSMSRVLVDSLAGKTIRLRDRVGAVHDFFRITGFEAHPRFFLENAVDFLDSEGEFFLDNNTRRFHLHGTDFGPSMANVVQPTIPTLLVIGGTAEKPAKNISIEGLIFSDTTCLMPSHGYAGIQASHFERRDEEGLPVKADSVHESDRPCPPPAVDVSFALGCVFRDCEFRNLGGGGVYFGEQTRQSKLLDCKFDDIGANGIMIGETVDRPYSKVVRANEIRQCHITDCGQVLFGSVGVWVGIASETKIVGNEISQLPYTGISVGWRWSDAPSGCQQNQIVDNHIHHVMQKLSDGGGIYTLGRQPGTRLAKNHIHDVPLNLGRAESNGIFMDEGSSEILVDQNLIYNIARSPIRFHKCKSNEIRSNRLYVAQGVTPFTYNNTDKSLVKLDRNQVLSGVPAIDDTNPE